MFKPGFVGVSSAWSDKGLLTCWYLHISPLSGLTSIWFTENTNFYKYPVFHCWRLLWIKKAHEQISDEDKGLDDEVKLCSIDAQRHFFPSGFKSLVSQQHHFSFYFSSYCICDKVGPVRRDLRDLFWSCCSVIFCKDIFFYLYGQKSVRQLILESLSAILTAAPTSLCLFTTTCIITSPEAQCGHRKTDYPERVETSFPHVFALKMVKRHHSLFVPCRHLGAKKTCSVHLRSEDIYWTNGRGQVSAWETELYCIVLGFQPVG